MSLKRVVLIAAMVALVSPAAALADGVTFGFTDGNLTIARPFQLGSSGSTSGSTRLTYVTRFSGTSPFGLPIAPTYGVPPSVLPPFSHAPNSLNFGTMTFLTGSVIGSTATSATFGAGGLVTITSGGTFNTLTGIPNGTSLFTGWFTGPTTMVQTNFCAGTCGAYNFHYLISGPIAGNLDPALMSLMGLDGPPGSQGLFLQILVGFIGATDAVGNLEGGALSVVPVPEPGTLALFGTGLIGVAGFIRRRLKA